MEQFTWLFVVGVIMAAVAFLRARGHLSVQVEVEKKSAPLTMEQIRALTAFANEQHQRIGNYMQANWSGAPEELSGVLARLIESIEQDARARGLTTDRDVIESMVEASLRAHKVAKGGDVREALKKVA